MAVRTALAGIAICTVLVLGTIPAVRGDTARAPAGETHRYGEQPRQRLTVYAPRWADQPRPGILLLHGGYWAHRTGWDTRPEEFTARGYLVLDVDYALNGDASWPAQREDTLAALDWSVRNAARIGLDPARIVVLGSSAGGHLAADLATYGAAADLVRGVVGLSPVASPYRAWLDGGRPDADFKQRRLRDEAERLIGCPPVRSDARCWRLWRDAVVKNHARLAPGTAMLLLHSAADFVPAAHSRDLAAAVPGATVRVVPGGAHGNALLDDPETADAVLAWIRARLR